MCERSGYNVIELQVYDRSMNLQGDISEYESLEMILDYTNVSKLILYIPKSRETVQLLKYRNILATYERPEFGFIIEHLAYIKKGGMDAIEVYAYSLNYLLKNIVIPTQMYKAGNVEDLIKYFIYFNAIAPSNPNRAIPDLVLGENTGIAITDESTAVGVDLLEHSFAIGNKHEVCVDVLMNHEDKAFEVVTWQGQNRATDQNVNPHVMFSTEFDNILEQNYFKSFLDYKNVAIVAGEGEGVNRTIVVVNDHIVGDERREVFIEAKDLTRTYYNEHGTQITLTNAQYIEALRNKGLEMLENYKAIGSFESTIADNQFVLNEDYSLGDRVTFEDEDLDINMHVRVSKVRILSNRKGITYMPSFGTGIPNKISGGIA